MFLVLILNLSLIRHYYGNIPEFSDAPPEAYELHRLDFPPTDFIDVIDLEFAFPVNDMCDALLGPGDVDYLDARQCELLVPWLAKRLAQPCPYPLNELYPKLLEFAQRAVELGTGVVVDL